MPKSSTYKEESVSLTHLTMLLILILNRVGDMMLPCGTPCYCSKVSDNVEPIRTLKDLSDKKFDVKFGKRPLRPKLCKSFMMPYFHVVS